MSLWSQSRRRIFLAYLVKKLSSFYNLNDVSFSLIRRKARTKGWLPLLFSFQGIILHLFISPKWPITYLESFWFLEMWLSLAWHTISQSVSVQNPPHSFWKLPRLWYSGFSLTMHLLIYVGFCLISVRNVPITTLG